MGTAQWAQKSEQADIEIFLATLYKIKSTTLIVKHKVLGKYLKQEKAAGNENKIHETLAPPVSTNKTSHICSLIINHRISTAFTNLYNRHYWHCHQGQKK